MAQLSLTGERYIPGASPQRIAEDHEARYRFACRFAHGKRVLDIACGVGFGSRMLAEAGASRVTGVDIDPATIAYAKHTFAHPRVRFAVGDITTFRPSDTVDLIVCFETIEHVARYHEMLDNLNCSLRAGGWLLISSPNRTITSPRASRLEDTPANRHHRQEFTPAELVAIMRGHGFTVAADNVLGQRPYLPVSHPFLLRAYHLLRPSKTTSSHVQRIRWRIPRYIVIRAQRP